LKDKISWDVKQFQLVDMYECFKGSVCLHLQDQAVTEE